MISFAGAVIICSNSGGFRGGMPKAEDVEGRGKETGEVGGMMGVGSEGKVPVETKAGAVVQTRSSYIDNLQDPGISMVMDSGVRSWGFLIESGVSGSGRMMSSSIGEGVCHSVSESMIV